MATIALKINGKDYTFHADKSTTLIDILRDKLDLTGAKFACGYGKCGACTVMMNGKAVRSCIVKALKADKAEVVTIEGITDGSKLHPIQEAFIEAGAVQCGFCTPGLIMTLYALYQKDLEAPIEVLRALLERHLCRCTGYENILKAALLAREKMREVKASEPAQKTKGKLKNKK